MNKLFNMVQYGLAANYVIYLMNTYLDTSNYFHAFFVIPIVMTLHLIYTMKYMFDHRCTKIQHCLLFVLYNNCVYFKMYYDDMSVQTMALLVAISAANLAAIAFGVVGGGRGDGEKKDN